jgi:hypothetical protein
MPDRHTIIRDEARSSWLRFTRFVTLISVAGVAMVAAAFKAAVS